MDENEQKWDRKTPMETTATAVVCDVIICAVAKKTWGEWSLKGKVGALAGMR